jgi:hypothetical protein
LAVTPTGKKPEIRLSLGYCLLVIVSWWLMPPPESRYLLGTLPLLIILLITALASVPNDYKSLKISAVIAILISIMLTTTLRFAASAKYIPLLSGQISRQEYIQSQTTDFNRAIIEKYHSGYWHNYRYK